MSREAVVQVSGLHKQFEYVDVLEGVDLEIHPGRIVGLIGANGCGKSTLIRHLVGLYLPDRGQVTTFGCDAGRLGPAELERIGYVHQEGKLIDWMSVSQLVRYVASHYANWNRQLEEDWFRNFELDRHALVGELSPGQRQMLSILLAVGFEPDLLILDEPAAALDPLARRRFLDLLLSIIQDPRRTILISSHILSDIEKVIDHVIILGRGNVLRDAPYDALQEEFVKLRLRSGSTPLPDPLPIPEPLRSRRNGHEAVVTLRARSDFDPEACAAAVGASCERLPLSLEELYSLVVQGAESES